MPMNDAATNDNAAAARAAARAALVAEIQAGTGIDEPMIAHLVRSFYVTACPIAQPPNGGLCHEASARPVTRPSRSSATRAYRQLPGWILPPLVNRAVGAH